MVRITEETMLLHPVVDPELAQAPPSPTSWRSRRNLIALCCLIPVVLLALAAPLINRYWPFRYRNVKPLLENVFASHITISSYHRVYFPQPGFVAEGLTLRRNSAPDLPPVGSAQRLFVQGRWTDLLTLQRRVRIVDVTGLHVVIPPVGSRANKEDFPPGASSDFAGPTTVIDNLDIHESLLDIMKVDGTRYSFPIRDLLIQGLRRGRTITYSLDMQNARPVGHIRSTGSFGPLLPGHLGDTSLSGSFDFSPADLASVPGIRGTLSSTGKFHGNLRAIQVDTRSDIPDFAVGQGQPTHVSDAATGSVNALNGDIAVDSINVHTGRTTLLAKGTIAGRPALTDFNIVVTQGRAEDILRPFMRSTVPIAGPVWLRTHAVLAPSGNHATFLQRLGMTGDFGIPSERFTDRTTQKKLSAFSLRAQGIKSPEANYKPGSDGPAPDDVFSRITGAARVRNGVATTDRLGFSIPGAFINLRGAFRFPDQSTHLLGDLHMDSDISHVTTGFKSVLLKPLAPFFKKDHAGAVIPIAITGDRGHYKISSNIRHKK